MGAQVESRESSGLTGCTQPSPPGFFGLHVPGSAAFDSCHSQLPTFCGLHSLGIPSHLMASSSSSDSLVLLCCPDIPALVASLVLPAFWQPVSYTTQPPRRLLTPPSPHSAPTPATCIHKAPNSTHSYIGAHNAWDPQNHLGLPSSWSAV